MADGSYMNAFEGTLELTTDQARRNEMIEEIICTENMLTVRAHPIDKSKPDVEYKDVFDICHLFGNDTGDGTFHQTLRLLSLGECKCMFHYVVQAPETCEKEHIEQRDYISLNDYTVEIAMQKGERGNG